MSLSYSQRRKSIKEMYDYEVSHNIPEEKRLTCGTADNPDKKLYVNILRLRGHLTNLRSLGEL